MCGGGGGGYTPPPVVQQVVKEPDPAPVLASKSDVKAEGKKTRRALGTKQLTIDLLPNVSGSGLSIPTT
jgi:hypothetical protein